MKISNWKSLAPNQKILLRFLAMMTIFVIVYFFWFVPRSWTLPIIGENYARFVHYTMMALTESTVVVLKITGYQAETFNLRNIDMYDSSINVHVRNFCLGIDMMAMFTALILSFPGKWKSRFWFIPLGFLGIHIINVCRVTALCIVTVHYGYSNFIDRHIVFNAVATLFIFLMFVQWVKMNNQAQAYQTKS